MDLSGLAKQVSSELASLVQNLQSEAPDFASKHKSSLNHLSNHIKTLTARIVANSNNTTDDTFYSNLDNLSLDDFVDLLNTITSNSNSSSQLQRNNDIYSDATTFDLKSQFGKNDFLSKNHATKCMIFPSKKDIGNSIPLMSQLFEQILSYITARNDNCKEIISFIKSIVEKSLSKDSKDHKLTRDDLNTFNKQSSLQILEIDGVIQFLDYVGWEMKINKQENIKEKGKEKETQSGGAVIVVELRIEKEKEKENDKKNMEIIQVAWEKIQVFEKRLGFAETAAVAIDDEDVNDVPLKPKTTTKEKEKGKEKGKEKEKTKETKNSKEEKNGANDKNSKNKENKENTNEEKEEKKHVVTVTTQQHVAKPVS